MICDKCELSKDCLTPCMPGFGSEHPSLLLVGEGPGCIAGDSLVEVAFRDKSTYSDGIPVRDLVGKENFYVYSCDVANRKLAVGVVKRVWKTGKKKVYRVEYAWKYAKGNRLVWLRNSIKVTSNHRFLLKPHIKHDPFCGILRDGVDYLSVEDGLSVGDSLQPFLRRNSNYSTVGISRKETHKESRFLLEYKLGRDLFLGEECYHIDRNKLNDRWDNVELQTKSSHAYIHSQGDENPMSTQSAREKHRIAVESEEYRDKLSRIMKDVLSDPEVYEARLSQIQQSKGKIQATLLERYKEPEFYYKYLLARQKYFGLSDDWLEDKFEQKFPGVVLPVDNHKVISIEYIGVEDVYDIEVEEYHNFAVNGIFVHNSQEDEQGRPFAPTAKAGGILQEALDVLELKPDDYRLTNVVRCRPPDNRTPKPKEIAACLPYLVDEITEYKPRVVVLLGNVPLKAVLGESGITQWNGVVVERDGITYVPAFHPSFFNYGNGDKLEEWMQALQRAVEIADGAEFKAADSGFEFVYPKTQKEFRGAQRAIAAFDGYVTYDVEAQYLDEFNPDNRILSASLAIDGVVWSFPLYHKENAIAVDRDCALQRSLLEEVLTTKRIVGHNIRFDCKQTRRMLAVEFKPWGDTMLISQLIDSKPGGHGLKRLAGLYLGMYDYDKELNDYTATHADASYNKGGHYGNTPLSILLPYGAKDAAATWQLYKLLYEQMTDTQRVLYHELIVNVDYVLGRMECNGFLLDKYISERYLEIYRRVRDGKYFTEIMRDKAVKRFCNDRQNALDVEFEAKKASSRRISKRPMFYFNPNSSDQMAEVFYTYKKYKPQTLTATGKPSVSMDALRYTDVAKDSLFESYRRWKLFTSMIDKYLEPPTLGEWDNGDRRVRANFNLGGAVTGRLSAASPNLQNIPAPEKEPDTLLAQLPIKNIFTHTWLGGCLCAADYAQMELRVMASVAGCVGMLEAFSQGLDIHSYVTRMLFPDEIPTTVSDKEIKRDYTEWRYRAKGASFLMGYGGGASTLHSLFGIGLREAEDIISTYFKRFPEILGYQQDTIDFAKRNGYVESPFGRRLYTPDINDRDSKRAADAARTAVNAPIQGTASDVLLCAVVVIDDNMRKDAMKTMLVNTVHDSLVGDVYPGELDSFAELCVDVMENIKEYAAVYFPHMDFSWLKIPLEADIEVGSHYGALSPWEALHE